MNHATFPPPRANQASPNGVDADLAARLERLAASRARTTGSSKSSSSPSSSPSSSRTGAGRRKHPASGARLAALGVSLAASGGLGAVFYLADQSTSIAAAAPSGIVPATNATLNSTVAPATAATVDAPATTPTAPATAPATTAPAVVALEVPATAAPAAPVVVNGETFSNRWGPVQVQATFGSDGALMSVDVLQTPTADGKSVRINNRAVPVLNQEALSAQSANIDTVSGATYTSNDYVRSLQAAIDIARANGVTQIA
jgi:uncharacterized protein with FMN-binding domain